MFEQVIESIPPQDSLYSYCTCQQLPIGDTGTWSYNLTINEQLQFDRKLLSDFPNYCNEQLVNSKNALQKILANGELITTENAQPVLDGINNVKERLSHLARDVRLRYHPDKNKLDTTSVFQELNESLEALLLSTRNRITTDFSILFEVLDNSGDIQNEFTISRKQLTDMNYMLKGLQTDIEISKKRMEELITNGNYLGNTADNLGLKTATTLKNALALEKSSQKLNVGCDNQWNEKLL
jgi:hypothetical protein